MFAAAKNGNVYSVTKKFIHKCFESKDCEFKKTFKIFSKNIVGIKKGFYICTRLGDKRPEETNKQVHRHIELTA